MSESFTQELWSKIALHGTVRMFTLKAETQETCYTVKWKKFVSPFYLWKIFLNLSFKEKIFIKLNVYRIFQSFLINVYNLTNKISIIL